MSLKRSSISVPSTNSTTPTAAAASPNRQYYTKRDFQRPTVLSRYAILGFLSSGTYGRVYKARIRKPNSQSNTGSPAGLMGTPGASTLAKRVKLTKEDGEEREGDLVAIKKFKPDKDGEAVTFTGISQSACREIMINREISHEHVTALREVMLEEKSIYLVFEFAEHDFLQIIHHHSSTRSVLPFPVLKSLLWQLLNGIAYLHDNWIIHRDLKPANILVTASGQVKIGDLGLARLYQEPLQSLYTSDKIVVTVWYRAPELLLGARHYTPAIDQWSLGCIFGELLALRPMFKGEEAKIDVGGGGKKGGVPFQKDQITRVVELLGKVDKSQWPGVVQLPEFSQLSRFERHTNELYPWFSGKIPRGTNPALGYEFLRDLLVYDPTKRMTAREALVHKWWSETPKPHSNAFLALPPGASYPLRRVTHDDVSNSAANKSNFGSAAGVSSGPVAGGSGLAFAAVGTGTGKAKRGRNID